MANPPCLRAAALLLAALSLPVLGASAQMALRPMLIGEVMNGQKPYVDTGRLTVSHGSDDFFGTATQIRRYTALTCGHLLYHEGTGFSTNVVFEPHYFEKALAASRKAAKFGVLSGYTSAVNTDGDSDPAFARDLGDVTFVTPALNNDWAEWQSDVNLLTQSGQRLVIGYAAETFTGEIIAAVSSNAPYTQLQEGLYESTDYYTQSGMSGGPVYLFEGGIWQIFAETVAGTSPPVTAVSDVRAITTEARTLLIDQEYDQRLIKNGFIKGSTVVDAGSVVSYKVGVNFADGLSEGTQLPPRYSELKLKAAGPNKANVSIVKKKTGKYKIDFRSLAAGQTVELRLLRDTAPNAAQTPLATLMVTAR